MKQKILFRLHEEEMFTQVWEMLKAGKIEPSTSDWVPDSHGEESQRQILLLHRLPVNTVSKADMYPVPYMNSIFWKLWNVRYIITLGLNQAYHQILLRPGSRPITAFTVPGLECSSSNV